MASLRLLLLPTLVAAHVTLNAPASVGPFDEDAESSSPCGGVTIDFSKDNVTDFHVGGEPIDLFLGHPTAGWLIRGTLDQTAASNWSQLYPIFTQTGLGDYCQPAVAAPESWVGQKGILGVVANAPDGLLYQCATVNFVSGSGTRTSDCNNGSAVTAAFSTDASLSALVQSDHSTTNGTSTSSGSSSSSSSKSMAPGLAPSINGLAGSLAAVVVASFFGAGLLL
ncbi:hypothetical protein N8I77_007788 [Diaporthe amygdali]|uniref:Copper acquisition factor BIM1-like domain-containing protein n=1 Tax=Phomopsis amygdali TaxID=1214568 RepID=A0AAD9SCU8_PHOAM|nr:hypothetical protein N8I77_007788 [Diaporthe amygdali]